MLKSILKGAVVFALFLGVSYSNIAQPKAVSVDSDKKKIDMKTSSLESVDSDNTRRIEAQLQRYKDYNLTDNQQKEIIKILTDSENQLRELRSKIGSLEKEKIEKIESLFTDEQKNAKEQSLKDKREKMLEQRKDAMGKETLKPSTPVSK